MSKHLRSFLTLVSFSIAEKRPREKTYLWCPLLSIIIIIIIIFTSSVSSLHQEYSHNQAWDEVSSDLIVKCFEKTKLYPKEIDDEDEPFEGRG